MFLAVSAAVRRGRSSVSPHAVAKRFGHADVHALLASRSPARVRFLDALLAADEPAAKAMMRRLPFSLLQSLTHHQHGRTWRTRSSTSSSTRPT